MLPNSFDLVVAADLLPYFGALSDLFRAIAAVTRPGGLVAFNADALDVDEEASSASSGGGASGNTRAFELKFTGRCVVPCCDKDGVFRVPLTTRSLFTTSRDSRGF